MNFYERLLNKFGGTKQILKCIEELNELQQVLIWELTKKDKNSKYIREKVLEEMSDVLMTFESLKLIYNISDKEIQDQINFKEDKKIKELFSEDCADKVINEGEDELIENMLIERKDQKGKYSLDDLRKKLNKENNFNG